MLLQISRDDEEWKNFVFLWNSLLYGANERPDLDRLRGLIALREKTPVKPGQNWNEKEELTNSSCVLHRVRTRKRRDGSADNRM